MVRSKNEGCVVDIPDIFNGGQRSIIFSLFTVPYLFSPLSRRYALGIARRCSSQPLVNSIGFVDYIVLVHFVAIMR